MALQFLLGRLQRLRDLRECRVERLAPVEGDVFVDGVAPRLTRLSDDVTGRVSFPSAAGLARVHLAAAAKKKASAIHITRFDKTRLTALLRSLDAAQGTRAEFEDLEQELERGIEVESTEVAPDVVTMNSTVCVTDLDANTTHLYTIVFPSDADFDKGRISILSPLGTALLGYRTGDVVEWEMPRGTRRLRIEELVYQPEAAGDFHL